MTALMDSMAAGLFALVGGLLIALVLARLGPARMGGMAPPGSLAAEEAVFLFNGAELIDATAAARQLLRGAGTSLKTVAGSDRGAKPPAGSADGPSAAAGPGRGSDRERVIALLGRRFGTDLTQRLAGLPPEGRLLLTAPDGSTLLAEAEAPLLRLSLRPGPDGGTGLDRLALEVLQEELDLLRGLAGESPQPAWALDAAGTVIWANRAYLALSDLMQDGAPAPPAAEPETPEAEASPPPGAFWPTVPLFGPPPALTGNEPVTRRLSLSPPGSREPLWYEVTSVRHGSGSLHFAADATGAVRAETARHDLVRALGKTFAHLSTGLAVFDRSRRLVLFNPAFVEMTGLPPPFLAARPRVQTVLDRLRDAGLLPEPRHYASWRDQLAALEAEARRDRYCETWSLPGERTWRVTGRPHPDGALVFLFEDISEEMGLARRFRAEIDCLRAVLDAMGEAVAVFGPSGALCLANAAYRQLWGGAGDIGPAAGSRDSLAERDIAEEAARWEAACVPSPVWAELREGRATRSWKAGILLRDGRSVSASTERLPGGMTLARFREEAPPGAPLKASRATRSTLSSGNSPAVLALGEEAACWTPAESRTSRGPRRRPGRRRSARTGQTAPQETV